MAIPKLKKSWQFSVNDYQAAGANSPTDYQKLIFRIKNLMVSVGSHPWTVVASSDSVSTGASDLWTDYTKCVWVNPSGAHAWIVLKQTGIMSNFQVCIDLLTTLADWWEKAITVVVSPAAGFTGGTTSLRPTAADEIVLRDGTAANGYWFGSYGSWGGGFPTVTHYLTSTDGTCTRIVICTGGVSQGFWLFDALSEAPPEMPAPFIADVWNDGVIGTSHMRYADVNDNARAVVGATADMRSALAYLTSEGFNNACVGENIVVANDIGAVWPLMGVGVACEAPGARGRLGGLADCWWGSTGVGEGNTYPNDSSRKYAQFGHLVLPWNGTVPVINTPPGTDTQRAAYDIQPALPAAPRIVPVSDD